MTLFQISKSKVEQSRLTTDGNDHRNEEPHAVGHIRRMEDTQLPKVTLYDKLVHNSTGGQRKRYRD